MISRLLKHTQANAPLASRLAGRFCVRKRGRVAYCSELTPRRTFGRPNPSQGPVSSNLTASSITNHHNQSSGADGVGALSTPDHRPRDEPDADEAWSFVGKKQKNVLRHEIDAKGDQYVFIGLQERRRQSLAGASANGTPKAPWTSCTICVAVS
jgi:hypothetical protein